MLEMVRASGRAIEYISDDLKKDREFIETAVCENGFAYEYLSGDFKISPKLERMSIESKARRISQNPKLLIRTKLTDDLMKQIIINGAIRIRELEAELKSLKEKESQAKELYGQYETQLPTKEQKEI